MITITISGARGEGKTTTAIAIATMLRMIGQRATYRGFFSDVINEQIVEITSLDDATAGLTEFREYQIIDKDCSE